MVTESVPDWSSGKGYLSKSMVHFDWVSHIPHPTPFKTPGSTCHDMAGEFGHTLTFPSARCYGDIDGDRGACPGIWGHCVSIP